MRLRLDGVGLYFDAVQGIFPGNLFVPDDIHGLLNGMWRMSHGKLVEVYREGFGRGPVTNEHADRFFAAGPDHVRWSARTSPAFITPPGTSARPRATCRCLRPRYLSRSFDLGDSLREPPVARGLPDLAGRAGPPLDSTSRWSATSPRWCWRASSTAAYRRFIVRQIDDRLSRATYVEFPASGHLQLGVLQHRAKRCARAIADDVPASPLAAARHLVCGDAPGVRLHAAGREPRRPRGEVCADWSRRVR